MNLCDDIKSEHDLIQTKKSIVNIMILLMNKFDKITIEEFQKHSEVYFYIKNFIIFKKTFGKIIENEGNTLENIGNLESLYIIDQFIALINIYMENFLKDEWYMIKILIEITHIT